MDCGVGCISVHVCAQRTEQDSPAEGSNNSPVMKRRSGEGSWSEMLRLTFPTADASAPMGERNAWSGEAEKLSYGTDWDERIPSVMGSRAEGGGVRGNIWSGSAGAPYSLLSLTWRLRAAAAAHLGGAATPSGQIYIRHPNLHNVSQLVCGVMDFKLITLLKRVTYVDWW